MQEYREIATKMEDYLDLDLPDLADFLPLGASLIPFVLRRCFLFPSVTLASILLEYRGVLTLDDILILIVVECCAFLLD
jgi:hypothetical protein